MASSNDVFRELERADKELVRSMEDLHKVLNGRRLRVKIEVVAVPPDVPPSL